MRIFLKSLPSFSLFLFSFLFILLWTVFKNPVFGQELLPPAGNFGIQLLGAPPSSKDVSQFGLVILNGHRDPPITKDTLIFGYFSVGEVKPGTPEEAFARKHKLIIGQNRDWKSLIVDPRKKIWQRYILEYVFPSFKKRGFSGIFLDTIDSPLILEKQDPVRYKGMRMVLVNLIKTAHQRYPETPIILNRALWILPTVARSIQGVLFEDFCREYYFRKKKYDFVPTWVVRRDNAFVRIAKVINPQLTVLTVDYGNPTDLAPMRHCFYESRKRGYHPYFTTLHVNQLRTFNLHY